MKKSVLWSVLTCAALSLSAEIPAPVADLALNGGDFDTIKDLSEKCKVAVYTREKLGWGEGPDGPALQFNGDRAAPRGALAVTPPADFSFAKGFSLRINFKTPDDYQRNFRYQLFHVGTGADTITGISLFVYWRAVYCRFGNASRKDMVTPPSALAVKPGTWYDCVLTYDGQNLVIYVNGKAMTEPTPFQFPALKGNAFFIGTTAVSGAGYGCKGLISQVRLYDRALTADEVSGLE